MIIPYNNFFTILSQTRFFFVLIRRKRNFENLKKKIKKEVDNDKKDHLIFVNNFSKKIL